jgi:hypothetical protein
MTLGTSVVSQPLKVIPDPRAGGTPADEREHAAMVATLAGMTAELNRGLTDLRDVRTQARALAERARSAPVAARDAAIQSFIVAIDSLEASAVSPPIAGIDIMHYTPRLTTDVSGLLSAVEGSSAPVTSGEREQFARLRSRTTAFRGSTERLLTADLERVNGLVTSTGLTPPLARRRPP